MSLGVDGLRIGVPRNYFPVGVAPSIRSAMEASLGLLERAGATLVPLDVPQEVAAMAELSRAVVYAEATALHAAGLRNMGSRYTPQVRLRASTGLGIPAPVYLEALHWRLPVLRRFVEQVFSRCDVLQTPTIPIPVPRRDETDVGAGPALWELLAQLVRCTAPFNYLGLPAISVPAGLDGETLCRGRVAARRCSAAKGGAVTSAGESDFVDPCSLGRERRELAAKVAERATLGDRDTQDFAEENPMRADVVLGTDATLEMRKRPRDQRGACNSRGRRHTCELVGLLGRKALREVLLVRAQHVDRELATLDQGSTRGRLPIEANKQRGRLEGDRGHGRRRNALDLAAMAGRDDGYATQKAADGIAVVGLGHGHGQNPAADPGCRGSLKVLRY
jgi:hypothetical protein